MLGPSRGVVRLALQSLLPIALVAAVLISTDPAGAAISQEAVNNSFAPTCSSSSPIMFGPSPSSGLDLRSERYPPFVSRLTPIPATLWS